MTLRTAELRAESAALSASAQWYVAAGYRVVPLRAGSKKPLHWECYDRALSVPWRVRLEWFGACYNIGLVVGPEAGLLVLDVDRRNGGDRALAELQSRCGPLPVCPTVRTHDGHHFWVRHPGGQLPGVIGLGGGVIELKGSSRGHVLAPPSVHPEGARYEWVLPPWGGPTTLPDLPPRWLELLASLSPRRLGDTSSSEQSNVSVCQDGAGGWGPTTTSDWGWGAIRGETAKVRQARVGSSRHLQLHNSALKLASRISGGEIAEADARAALVSAGLDVGLSEGDVSHCVASGYEHGRRNPISRQKKP